MYIWTLRTIHLGRTSYIWITNPYIKPGQADRSEGIWANFSIFDKNNNCWPKNVINFGPRGILQYSLDETDRMEQSGAWDFATEFKIDRF